MTEAALSVESNAVAVAILRESVASRASQARVSFIGTIVALSAFTPILFNRVPASALVLWIAPVLVILTWRLDIASRASARVAAADEDALKHFDRIFRINSVINQFWIGTGVWYVAMPAELPVHYMVTLAVSFFGIGATVSLVNDFKTVLVSLPILFGQCVLFWLLQGIAGLHMAVPLLTILLLNIAYARRTQQVYSDSIATRFEKNALLANLEAEKSVAEHARLQAEEANRSKSKFLAAASHDLRQPLYAVTLLRDTLAMHDLEPPVKEIVDQQGVALAMLAHLFDNLLEVSRLESGSVAVNLDTLSVKQLLGELEVEFRPTCEQKGLAFHVDAPDVFIRSDPELAMRLMRNLLSNAVRYTESGTVEISARCEGAKLHVAVTDTGAGIDEADQQRVFQEFVQLDNPQRDRAKGFGLGLAIVHHIANILNLDLDLQSVRGAGTTVTVSFPITAGVVRPDRDEVEAPVALHDTEHYLWIVEDDELLRSALHVHLNTLGVPHDFAVSRAELDRLQRDNGWPDFAILDDMLGNSDSGLDIAQWLAGNMATDHILMVTGNSEPERLAQLESSNFEVMRKPITSDDLVAWLNRPRASA